MGVEFPSDVGIGDALPAALPDNYENSPKFLLEKVSASEIPLLDTPLKAKDSCLISNGISVEQKMDAVADEQAIVESHQLEASPLNDKICTGIEENGHSCEEEIDKRIEEDAKLDNGREDGRSAAVVLEFGTITAADMRSQENDDKHDISKSEEELGNTKDVEDSEGRNDMSDGLVSSTLEEVGNSFHIEDAGTSSELVGSTVSMLNDTVAAADTRVPDNDDAKHSLSKSEEEYGKTDDIEDSEGRNDSSDELVSSTLKEVGNSFNNGAAGSGNCGNHSSSGLVSSTVSMLDDKNTSSEGTSDFLENDKSHASSSNSDTEEIGNIGCENSSDGGPSVGQVENSDTEEIGIIGCENSSDGGSNVGQVENSRPNEQNGCVGETDDLPTEKSHADEKSVKVETHAEKAPGSVSGSIDECSAQSIVEVVDPDHICSETSDRATSSTDGSSPKTGARSSENPFPKRHLFYMVRIPYIEDHLEKTLKQEMEMRLQKYTAERDSIAAASKLKKAAKDEAYKKLECARKDEQTYIGPLSKNDEELKKLQFDLHLLDEAKRTVDRRNELSQKIAELEYQIQHESISLSFEKKLLQEIKKLKTARDKIPMHKKQDDPQQRTNIIERIKLLDEEYASLRKELKPLESKTRSLLSEYEALKTILKNLSADWEAANGRRQEAYRELRNLLDKEASRNAEFHRCRKERQLAKQCAFNNEKSKLENISKTQVERVLALWSSDAEFRSTYITYNQASTLRRLQTLDGRSLGPNEVPPSLVSVNLPAINSGVVSNELECPKRVPDELRAAEIDSKQKSTSTAPAIEGPTPSAGTEKKIIDLGGKPNGASGKNASINRKTTAEVIEYEEPKPFEEGSGSGKMEYKEEEQREKHRQEEMAKAKEAANRKKKLAERSQARALARAQKDAERREKEKGKQARKKAAAAAVVEPPLASNDGQQASENDEKKTDEAVPKAAPQARKRSAQKGRKTSDAPLKVIIPPRRNGRIQIWTKLKGSMSWLLAAGLSLLIVISVVAMSLQNYKAGVA